MKFRKLGTNGPKVSAIGLGRGNQALKFGDPLENLWKTCVLDFCGVKSFVRRLYAVVVISTVEQRREWLKDAENTIRESFPG